MTRKQVALRLGKSLATVRRIEGSLLHPTLDARGVHHFDDSEVETLARQVKSGRVQLSREFSPTNGEMWDFDSREPCEKCTSLERRLAELLDERDEQRRQHDLELRECQRERLDHEAESTELMEQLAELIDLVACS